MEINKEIISGMRNWLKDDGIIFFTKMMLEHGEISPVFNEGGFPHAVHFQEGMQVRNFLRQELCKDWNPIDLDDNWVKIVELAILKGKQ